MMNLRLRNLARDHIQWLSFSSDRSFTMTSVRPSFSPRAAGDTRVSSKKHLLIQFFADCVGFIDHRKERDEVLLQQHILLSLVLFGELESRVPRNFLLHKRPVHLLNLEFVVRCLWVLKHKRVAAAKHKTILVVEGNLSRDLLSVDENACVGSADLYLDLVVGVGDYCVLLHDAQTREDNLGHGIRTFVSEKSDARSRKVNDNGGELRVFVEIPKVGRALLFRSNLRISIVLGLCVELRLLQPFVEADGAHVRHFLFVCMKLAANFILQLLPHPLHVVFGQSASRCSTGRSSALEHCKQPRVLFFQLANKFFCRVFVDDGLSLNAFGAIGESQCRQRFVKVNIRGTQCRNHDGLAVASEGVLQELCQHRVAVWNKHILLPARLVSKCCNDVAQCGQRLIDRGAFLESIACGAGRVGALGSGEVNEVDVAHLLHLLSLVVFVLLCKVNRHNCVCT
eukprot:Opistho-2@22589